MNNVISTSSFLDDWANSTFPAILNPVVGRFTNTFKVDIEENDKSYKVTAELPGIKKENLDITVDRYDVTISTAANSTTTKIEQENKYGEIIRRERGCGKVSRAFIFSQEVESDTSTATYKDGILELILNKKNSSVSKKIAVN